MKTTTIIYATTFSPDIVEHAPIVLSLFRIKQDALDSLEEEKKMFYTNRNSKITEQWVVLGYDLHE